VARHHITEPRVRSAVDRLVAQFIRTGSVNALSDALTAAQPDPLVRLYPNRIHGLLAEDSSRSINTATLEAIEAGLVAMEAESGSGDGKVEQRVLAAWATLPAGTDHPLQALADATGVPVAVVGKIVSIHEPMAAAAGAGSLGDPDWSWQDTAVSACLRSLRSRADYKAGLVVPTGGGKTPIALRVALAWLAADSREDAVVLWVTHRRRLHLQARRALQKLLRKGEGLPEGAASLFANRVRFIMTGDLPTAIADAGDVLSLVIVDEGHHAAAASYQPIFTDAAAPGLLLTATPVRADEQPIGIDSVAYTTSYRELFERRCLVEPIFEPPLDLRGLDWSKPDGLRDLADYLLDRTENDFGKVLVPVSLRERAEVLYEALVSLLDERPDHPLSFEDIGFVHANRCSGSVSTEDFLDEFSARPNGILVATSQLVGEGYDDPSIDSVVVTYPSTSIGHLMQVAGRALRSAPGKISAHVVQVRESELEYHFDQRWLYQDISDQLRPALIDLTYSSKVDLDAQLTDLLQRYRIHPAVIDRMGHELVAAKSSGEDLQLMLTGLPYFGDLQGFETTAKWGAILVTPAERRRFVEIFNDVSYRTDDIKEQGAYLAHHLPPDTRAGSLWKSYVDLITAMEYARRELAGTPYAAASSRPYQRRRSTTWLRYVSFNFRPTIPPALSEFLGDAVNRDQIVAHFIEQPLAWAAAIKIELPLAGTFAYLFSDGQAAWWEKQRQELVVLLKEAAPGSRGGVIADWSMRLMSTPVAPALLSEMRQFSRPERLAQQYLILRPNTASSESEDTGEGNP
jgi:hypothetical protein